jgi:hypothetical protein
MWFAEWTLCVLHLQGGFPVGSGAGVDSLGGFLLTGWISCVAVSHVVARMVFLCGKSFDEIINGINVT